MDVPSIGHFHCCYSDGKVQTYAPNRACSSVSPLPLREIDKLERNGQFAATVCLIFPNVSAGIAII